MFTKFKIHLCSCKNVYPEGYRRHHCDSGHGWRYEFDESAEGRRITHLYLENVYGVEIDSISNACAEREDVAMLISLDGSMMGSIRESFKYKSDVDAHCKLDYITLSAADWTIEDMRTMEEYPRIIV